MWVQTCGYKHVGTNMIYCAHKLPAPSYSIFHVMFCSTFLLVKARIPDLTQTLVQDTALK